MMKILEMKVHNITMGEKLTSKMFDRREIAGIEMDLKMEMPVIATDHKKGNENTGKVTAQINPTNQCSIM